MAEVFYITKMGLNIMKDPLHMAGKKVKVWNFQEKGIYVVLGTIPKDYVTATRSNISIPGKLNMKDDVKIIKDLGSGLSILNQGLCMRKGTGKVMT